MTADKPIIDLLASPLSADWTIEGLADQLLDAIAARREAQDLVLDAEATTVRQSHRLLRPLLACLASKSSAENGTPVNLFGGELLFKRRGPEGSIWILGQFENKPETVRAAFRRSASPAPQPAPAMRQIAPSLPPAEGQMPYTA